MPIPLPNLDDRRWADLVDEGRSLISAYSTEWTDFNPSDPGITLMELFAWVAEMDIYQLNRVPDRHKRKFLELIGVKAAPPRPARVGVQFQMSDTALVAAGTEFAVSGFTFRTLYDVSASPVMLQAIQTNDGARFTDVTSSIDREPLAAFGVPPATGSAVYFGLSDALAAGKTSSFLFHFSGSISADAGPKHHSAVVAWEYLDSLGAWSALTVDDATRSFSADGHVRVTGPSTMGNRALGRVSAPLAYVRVRYASGQYDTPPRLLNVSWNAVEAEQTQTIAQAWPIAAGTTASGTVPAAGATVALRFGFNAKDEIDTLDFGAAGQPAFRVLEYTPAAAAQAGRLIIELLLVARGTGGPGQQIALSGGLAVVESSVAIYTLENGSWRVWAPRSTFDASGPADMHYVLDSQAATVLFGDGLHGRALPENALLFADYLGTAASAGPVKAALSAKLLSNAHNSSLPENAQLGYLVSANTALPARPGADGESLGDTIARAAQEREAPLRAVTLADYEALARTTRGATIARVAGRANLYGPLDQLEALGIIALIVVPDMPVPMPRPSAGLLALVRARLNQRRVIGTRVEVIGPTYLQVGVNASVQSVEGQDPAKLQQAVIQALNLYLDPLKGGPGGGGWPFGRDIYKAEILSIIANVPGVDHVLSLSLVPTGCAPQCGNICLNPGWLATPGTHQIEVS
jgi:hypothetical protein